MSNAILTDILADSDLPGAVKRAIRAKADELMEADPAITEREAARMAVEEFHGITRDDLAATMAALEEEQTIIQSKQKQRHAAPRHSQKPTSGIGVMLSAK